MMTKKITNIEVQYYGEGIAESIRNIDKAIQKLYDAGFTKHGLVTLVAASVPHLTKTAVDEVLTAMANLKTYYLK